MFLRKHDPLCKENFGLKTTTNTTKCVTQQQELFYRLQKTSHSQSFVIDMGKSVKLWVGKVTELKLVKQ